jgi:hypothetical protein
VGTAIVLQTGPATVTPAQTAPAVATPATEVAVPSPAVAQPVAEAEAPAVPSTAPAEDSAPRAVVPASAEAPAEPPTAVGTEGDQAGLVSDDPFAQSANVLAGLQSYRYVTVFSFTGEVDGEPESGSIEMRGAVAGLDRQMATWKDLESGQEFGIIRIGDEAWMQEGETWTSVPTMVADLMAQAVLVFAPSASWEELAEGVGTTATYVGTETVNGIPARHYTSTYTNWMQAEDINVEDASGDIWMAEAGYPVRYRFTAKGVDEEGYKGSALWTMELSDVNGAVTIDAPPVAEESGE